MRIMPMRISKTMVICFSISVMLLTAVPASAQSDLFISNATIITGTGQTIENGSILIRDGKIARIGSNLSAPSGVDVIDASGKYVMPGIIDLHSHMGGGGNESTSQNSAMVDISDQVVHDQYSFYTALAGGVTTIHVLHGSANNIGGRDEVLKLKWGRPAEELLIPGNMEGVKFALGENPIRNANRYPNTRMGQEFQIRSYFEQGAEYKRRWDAYEAKLAGTILPANDFEKEFGPIPPRKDLRMETMKGILEGTVRVHSHGYSNSELAMLIRLMGDYGVAPHSLEHALEGYMIADEMAAADIVASIFQDSWNYKVEASYAIPFAAALLTERGVIVAINSDSGERIRRLNLDAAKTLRYGDGMDETKAIRTITYNAAYGLKLHDKIGTLEVGKDGDIAIYDGHPLSVFSKCVKTIIEGEVFFDRDKALTTEKWIQGAKPVFKIIGNEGGN
ncbi:amidohydrolase family protein [candidate division KSB1 bacterium]|nr:amidohydrolase family protein [candidate division KSB1 bacterium]